MEAGSSPRFHPGLADRPKPSAHKPGVMTRIHSRAVGGQVRPLGNDIQTREERNAGVEHQVHHVSVALFADELQGQEASHRLLSRNYPGSGQAHLPDDPGQIDLPHQRNEEKQPRASRLHPTRAQVQLSDVGGRRDLRSQELGPFLIEPPREPREPLLSQEDRKGVHAQTRASRPQDSPDVVHGIILLAQGHHEIAYAVALRGPSPTRIGEEAPAKRRGDEPGTYMGVSILNTDNQHSRKCPSGGCQVPEITRLR